MSPALMRAKGGGTLAVVLALIALPIVVGAQSPTGTWSIDLALDSAGTLGPRPTSRFVRGVVHFDSLHVDSGVAPNGNHWIHRYWPGRFAIDLSPFFGAPIGEDVSTTVSFPFDATSTTEVEAQIKVGTLSLDFIPAVSHGGISLSGVIVADSMVGNWFMRAYCCGA